MREISLRSTRPCRMGSTPPQTRSSTRECTTSTNLYDHRTHRDTHTHTRTHTYNTHQRCTELRPLRFLSLTHTHTHTWRHTLGGQHFLFLFISDPVQETGEEREHLFAPVFSAAYSRDPISSACPVWRVLCVVCVCDILRRAHGDVAVRRYELVPRRRRT